MATHNSRRCTFCAISWPQYDQHDKKTDEYELCPSCGKSTWGSTSDPDYTWDEARREKAYFDFDRYLEERDQEDRKMLERTEPFAFAQYLMDAAEEQTDREQSEPA